jgi:hypothetical protein
MSRISDFYSKNWVPLSSFRLPQQQPNHTGFQGRQGASTLAGKIESEGLGAFERVPDRTDRTFEETEDQYPNHAEKRAWKVQSFHIIFQRAIPTSNAPPSQIYT